LVSGLDLLRWVHPPAIALGADGTMLALNAECRAVVGASAERFLGQSCADVVREQLGDRGVCDSTTCASLAHLADGDGADLERCPLPQVLDARFSTAIVAVTVPPQDRRDEVAAVVLLSPQVRPIEYPEHTPARTPAASLGVRLLGSVEVVRDDVSVPVPRKRVRELLTLLVLSGQRGIGRDEACELLWPGAARGAGRGHLRVLLHFIRHLVGEELVEDMGRISGGDARLRLRAGVWTDVQVIDEVSVSDGWRDDGNAEARHRHLATLRRAVDHYQGDLDAGGEFGSWVIPYREQLRRRFLALVTAAISLAASLDEFDTAIECCRRAISIDPFDERFRLSLLALHGQQGQTEEARVEYEAYKRLLADDAENWASERSRRRASRVSVPSERREQR